MLVRLLTLWLALLLSACGGGGGASADAGAPAADKLGTARPALYGYYLGCSTYAVEQAGAANLWWASNLCGAGNWATAVASSLLAARATGGFNCVVLHLPDRQAYAGAAAVADLGVQLRQLAATGQLDGWPCVVLYPGDEPDRAGLDDATVTAGNAALRAVVQGIPQLRAAALAVFYACATGQTPGFASFNMVGCDDYKAGCAVTAAWDSYIARMAPEQVLMAISGGYSGAKQDPTCFKTWASRQTHKTIMVAFTWQQTSAGLGIRDDPLLRPLYTSLGRWVLTGSP